MEEKLTEESQRPESSAVHELDLVTDVVAEWDVRIPMRDGVVLRADVFRPVGDAPSPVLLSYGGYGKNLPIQVAYPAAWKILLKQATRGSRGFVGAADVVGAARSGAMDTTWIHSGSRRCEGNRTITWRHGQHVIARSR